jgi:hypothetical protein
MSSRWSPGNGKSRTDRSVIDLRQDRGKLAGSVRIPARNPVLKRIDVVNLSRSHPRDTVRGTRRENQPGLNGHAMRIQRVHRLKSNCASEPILGTTGLGEPRRTGGRRTKPFCASEPIWESAEVGRPTTNRGADWGQIARANPFSWIRVGSRGLDQMRRTNPISTLGDFLAEGGGWQGWNFPCDGCN